METVSEEVFSFDDFKEALSAYAEANEISLSGETKLWTDLGVWGMDALDLFANIEEGLGCSITGTFSIYDYVPNDTEVGVFGRLNTKRTISDLSLAELFAMLDFVPKGQNRNWPY